MSNSLRIQGYGSWPTVGALQPCSSHLAVKLGALGHSAGPLRTVSLTGVSTT